MLSIKRKKVEHCDRLEASELGTSGSGENNEVGAVEGKGIEWPNRFCSRIQYKTVWG